MYYSYASTTGSTNLVVHLESKHEITISSTHSVEKQRRISNVIFPNKDSESLREPKSNFMFFRQLALWFCRDLVTLDTVERKGFVDFWKYLQNTFELPSRSTVSIGAIDDLYICCKNKLIGRLTNSGQHATVTFDGWSDSHKHISYVTYTYHFIENWALKSVVLKTGSFSHPHTSKRIKEDFIDTMAEFNILDKRISIVTDGAKSMIRAAELLSVFRFGCVGHIIHLLFRADLLKHESMQPLRDLKVKLSQIHRKLMYKHEQLAELHSETIQDKILVLMEEFKEMGMQLNWWQKKVKHSYTFNLSSLR